MTLIFPDTYTYFWTARPRHVLRKLLDAQLRGETPQGEHRLPARLRIPTAPTPQEAEALEAKAHRFDEEEEAKKAAQSREKAAAAAE